MKRHHIILLLLCLCTAVAAQDSIKTNHHHHTEDTTDVFFRHMKLNELVVTGVTGDTKLKHSTAPINIVSAKDLHSTASTNVIDAIAHQPGMSQLTTGSGISKPIIRGLGYNRVVVMSEGVRQEGQQWGDEHGVEVDGGTVHSVEILKGPASLMYGSDAMAGVVILHSQPIQPEGGLSGNISTEYQTNNGLFSYSLNMAGNQKGFVWDARFSDKMAHAYKNKYDGYVPGSQFRERAGRLMLGLQKQWGHSRLTGSIYHLTPSIAEGERDEDTGELVHAEGWTDHQYSKSLPFQQVKHYKLVWDNSLNLKNGYLKAIVGYQQNRRQEFEEHHHEGEEGEEEHEHEHHSADEPSLFFKLHTLTYDMRYLTHEWDGWKLSAGVGGMWQKSQNLGVEYLIPDYRLFDIGLYTTVSKTIDRWTLGITGSVGAVWNMNDHLNLRLNVARGFRTPNMSELASNGVHEGSLRYEVGNQQLKAEYSLQADLGLDFTSRYVSAQLALFANHIDNYIFIKGEQQTITSEGNDYPLYAYTQGDARLLGFEAGVDFHPIHSLHFGNTFWTSELKWELAHHEHTTVGHHHEQDHRHFTSKIALNNIYIAAGLECYLRQGNIYSADNTETATPSYTLVNLSAGTDILWKHKKVAEFYVLANNLLNRAYQSHLSRLKYTDINHVTGRQGVYNMGRNVTFKLVIPIQF